MDGHGEFCCPSHRGLYYWHKKPERLAGLIESLDSDGLIRGRKRQVVLGRMRGAQEARKAAAAGTIGARRGYSDGEADWVLELKRRNPSWGRGSLRTRDGAHREASARDSRLLTAWP